MKKLLYVMGFLGFLYAQDSIDNDQDLLKRAFRKKPTVEDSLRVARFQLIKIVIPELTYKNNVYFHKQDIEEYVIFDTVTGDIYRLRYSIYTDKDNVVTREEYETTKLQLDKEQIPVPVHIFLDNETILVPK